MALPRHHQPDAHPPRAPSGRGAPPSGTPPAECQPRIVITNVSPQVDGGRFSVKRVAGDRVTVTADVFADGHDVLTATLLSVEADAPAHGDLRHWSRTPMEHLGNDRWTAFFDVPHLGSYRYTVAARRDEFLTWRRDTLTKLAAGLEVGVELTVGRALLEHAAVAMAGADATALRRAAAHLTASGTAQDVTARVRDEDLRARMARYAANQPHVIHEPELRVVVDRPKARFSTWYELFPRSYGPAPGVHGTLRDLETQLPRIATMGFDVLYLPPIHPIGTAFRKGPNSRGGGTADDPGSPWAIGSADGGHKAVHSQLGTHEDFRHLVAAAHAHGMEVALDLALQCSPDHPYVREHPAWFRHRPDGSIRYAENPPKNYQDIYPLDFDTRDRQALWAEVKSIVDFWIGQGVRMFRVDNPHTKPFAFWEWLIGQVQAAHPGVIFLGEAFTRPKVMARLAKLGFTQCYTYFTWRNTKQELEDYFTELTQTDLREFFRPNLWPNTPDILHETLQKGGRAAFMARLVLGATLGASYGIYGPAFELCVKTAREEGSEEYLDSEKYQLRWWDLGAVDSIAPLIAKVNAARRAHPALQRDDTLHFHATDNKHLICYSKRSGSDVVISIVNLDPRWTQVGWVTLDLAALGLAQDTAFEVTDLLTSERYAWRGAVNYVQLDPAALPAHMLHVQADRVEASP